MSYLSYFWPPSSLWPDHLNSPLGILNGFLAVYALPYMHGILPQVSECHFVNGILKLKNINCFLPQSPLHVVMMADQEEKLVENHYERLITKVRETRVTSILCNVLILLCFYLIPEYIKNIPVPVLDGLFLYCAIASLRGRKPDYQCENQSLWWNLMCNSF